mmetsp:Transcript_169065/g.543329  ORF Transcript_169065/g.543329 Transcript_169065/m.543329 type:complete len:253 (+) Transcript_169065:72-830(+)
MPTLAAHSPSGSCDQAPPTHAVASAITASPSTGGASTGGASPSAFSSAGDSSAGGASGSGGGGMVRAASTSKVASTANRSASSLSAAARSADAFFISGPKSLAAFSAAFFAPTAAERTACVSQSFAFKACSTSAFAAASALAASTDAARSAFAGSPEASSSPTAARAAAKAASNSVTTRPSNMPLSPAAFANVDSAAFTKWASKPKPCTAFKNALRSLGEVVSLTSAKSPVDTASNWALRSAAACRASSPLF